MADHASVGVPVIGTAWQGRAAEVLGREAGVERQTTALLLERLARGEEPIPRGAVVIVDEAGSMPTHAMERLVSSVAERGGRAILAGDSRQLPAIAAGGALACLADRLGAAELFIFSPSLDSAFGFRRPRGAEVVPPNACPV